MTVAIRRLSCAFVLFLAAGRAVVAQDVLTITGTVTTHADGLPVPGAVVSVVDGVMTATTDASGRYVLQVPRSLVRADRLGLKVEARGLPPKTTEVMVHAPTLTVDVSLALGFTEQIAVGSRTPGTQAEKAVPVDMITQDQIASSGYSETAPAFVPRRSAFR